MTNKPIIAITCGDPAGVGPEIVMKAVGDVRFPFRNCRIVLFGDKQAFQRIASILKIPFTIPVFSTLADFERSTEAVGLIDFATAGIDKVAFGEVNAVAGKASIDYVNAAVDAAIEGTVAAVVTCPINKESILKAGVYYPGHTELLKDKTGMEKVVMMLFGDKLRVALVTTHLALRDIFKAITKDNVVETIRITDRYLKSYFAIESPRIIVTGLNPHASDGGRFGTEDIHIIAPAIDQCKGENIDCEGPLPADVVFHKAVEENYDAVVAMYHDQGLGPLKLLHFGSAVNVTLGLPIIRTSVDHGTAFDIAGKGVARPDSLIKASQAAIMFYENLRRSRS